jgi:hypothetical protein
LGTIRKCASWNKGIYTGKEEMLQIPGCQLTKKASGEGGLYLVQCKLCRADCLGSIRTEVCQREKGQIGTIPSGLKEICQNQLTVWRFGVTLLT